MKKVSKHSRVILLLLLVISVYTNFVLYFTTNDVVTDGGQAINLVESESSEIVQWYDMLSEAKKYNTNVGIPNFSADKVDKYTYRVHAYESRDGYVVTKGYFYVDTRTGRVSKSIK